jgi:hypothetical protein
VRPDGLEARSGTAGAHPQHCRRVLAEPLVRRRDDRHLRDAVHPMSPVWYQPSSSNAFAVSASSV